jgi:hypothetical protein
MFVLKTLIKKYTQNNPKVLFSCFIDLRKAFDKVRHDGLLYKLRKNDISDLFYNIIKNVYQKTEYTTNCNTSIICGIIFRATFINRNNEPICPRWRKRACRQNKINCFIETFHLISCPCRWTSPFFMFYWLEKGFW